MGFTAFGPYVLDARTNISSYGPRARLIRAFFSSFNYCADIKIETNDIEMNDIEKNACFSLDTSNSSFYYSFNYCADINACFSLITGNSSL